MVSEIGIPKGTRYKFQTIRILRPSTIGCLRDLRLCLRRVGSADGGYCWFTRTKRVRWYSKNRSRKTGSLSCCLSFRPVSQVVMSQQVWECLCDGTSLRVATPESCAPSGAVCYSVQSHLDCAWSVVTPDDLVEFMCTTN